MTSADVTSVKLEDASDEHALREALSAAIAVERKARASTASAQEALARGCAAVARAEAELERTKKLVDAAKEHDARSTAAAVRKSADAAPDASATRKARLAVQECEDVLEAARGALGRFEADAEEQDLQAKVAANHVIVCRNEFLAVIAERLLSQAREAKMTLAIAEALVAGLVFVGDDGAPRFADVFDNVKAKESRDRPLNEITAAFSRFRGSGNRDTFEAAAAAEREMREAIVRLTADATVDLPVPR
jgi:hypothetical protein